MVRSQVTSDHTPPGVFRCAFVSKSSTFFFAGAGWGEGWGEGTLPTHAPSQGTPLGPLLFTWRLLLPVPGEHLKNANAPGLYLGSRRDILAWEHCHKCACRILKNEDIGWFQAKWLPSHPLPARRVSTSRLPRPFPTPLGP